jgi:murein DD-endopeptidase MepM/ murein hydrolase activator NlpD
MSDASYTTPPIDLLKTFSLEGKKDQPVDRAKIVQLAQEFEAMMMLQMVRQMRQSISFDDEKEQGFGNETMTDTFDVEFSRYLAQAGGVGLGKMIERGLEANPKITGKPAEPAAATAAAIAKNASTNIAALAVQADAKEPASATGLSMPLEADTTSGYGWRKDPLGHGRKFHSGVDLRAAYGTEVPAAAAGEVTFAGEQGGYGTMVVVRHEDGFETRYAHLSSTAVQAGDRVDAGQAVGRVGSSGRSTGPHLHFEVRRNGQQLDPAAVTAPHMAAFKFVSPIDDSLHERMLPGDIDTSVVSTSQQSTDLGAENEDPGRKAR